MKLDDTNDSARGGKSNQTRGRADVRPDSLARLVAKRGQLTICHSSVGFRYECDLSSFLPSYFVLGGAAVKSQPLSQAGSGNSSLNLKE
jgi:hypothetical protein